MKKICVVLIMLSLILSACSSGGAGKPQGGYKGIQSHTSNNSDIIILDEDGNEVGEDADGTSGDYSDMNYPYEIDLDEPGVSDIHAHNIYVDPDLSSTSGEFQGYCVDMMVVDSPDATYWTNANWRMKGGAGAYSGVQQHDDGVVTLAAYWDREDGTRSKRYFPDGDHTFTGEGDGTNCYTDYQWEPNHWYRYVVRSVNKNGTTYVEQWIQDKETAEWTLLTIFDVLLENSCMVGDMSFFMENYDGRLCNELRSFKLANMYIQEYGSDVWKPIDTATVSVCSYTNKKGGFSFGATDTYFWGMTSGSGPDLRVTNPEIPTEGTYTIKMTDSAPDFDFYYDYGDSSSGYVMDVFWSYVDSMFGGSQEGECIVKVQNGKSTVDPFTVHTISDGSKLTAYYVVNGEEVPVYSIETYSEGGVNHSKIEILRDDLVYTVAWESGPENFETDCKAYLYKGDEIVDQSSYEDRMWRSFVGLWYYGICSITNGEVGEYMDIN